MATGYSTYPPTRVTLDLQCWLLTANPEPMRRPEADPHSGPDPGPDQSHPLVAKLRWSTAVPEQVTAAIPGDGGTVEWLLSRDLLSDGCLRPSGIGDVSLIPRPDWPGTAELVLSSDTGRAALLFDVDALTEFLAIIAAQTCPNGCYRENRGGVFPCIRHEVSDIPPVERFLDPS